MGHLFKWLSVTVPTVGICFFVYTNDEEKRQAQFQPQLRHHSGTKMAVPPVGKNDCCRKVTAEVGEQLSKA